MSYLTDFIYYNSGNECPPSFWLWSALTLQAHVLGRKVWYMHGKFQIFPNLYTGLFGSAGSGKSTAKSEVKNIIVEHFPHLVYSASIQSREDIIKQMSNSDCIRTWKIPNEAMIQEYRPFFIIANEFENFLSVNPVFMIGFLVDIYDEKYFSTGFKKDSQIGAAQRFENPYVSILACGIPEWLMTELKFNLFKGGLGRRLILVVDEPTEAIPDPFQPKGWEVAKARVIEHLKQCELLQGEFQRTESAKKFWHEWYINHKKARPDDPILGQFWATKHVQVIKVAMGLAAVERPFKMEIRAEHFEGAVAMIDSLMPKVQQLTSGIGKNEVAGVGVQILELIRMQGGIVRETVIKGRFFREMPGHAPARALEELLQHLSDSKQIVRRPIPKDGVFHNVIFLPDKWEAFVKEMEAKEKPK